MNCLVYFMGMVFRSQESERHHLPLLTVSFSLDVNCRENCGGPKEKNNTLEQESGWGLSEGHTLTAGRLRMG